ncbi:hypothetical protein H6F80_28280 [Leptolyngbya sp. FACHB-711]|nr:hypothetical protein [Leptolyngbya sp. FACHB-711]
MRWRLPRPSLVGLAAGTCIVYEIQGEVNKEEFAKKLTQVQAAGIGERRAEGYGQLIFNDPLLMKEIGTWKPPEDAIKANPDSSSVRLPTSDSYARILEQATWRAAIQREALGLASSSTQRQAALGLQLNPPIPKTSAQLGSLRSLVARLQTPSDVPGMIAWLDRLEQTANRKDKWSDDSLQAIRSLVSQPGRVWELLKIQSRELTLTQQGEQYWQRELWAEAVRTLVDACIRAHQREGEPKPTENRLAGVGGGH